MMYFVLGALVGMAVLVVLVATLLYVWSRNF
jgi:hypothetical protein